MKPFSFCIVLLFALLSCKTANQLETVCCKMERGNGHLSKIMKDGRLYIGIIRDASGRIVEKKEYWLPDGEPTVEKYTYNSDGRLVKREYSAGYSDVYIYKNGRLAETVSTKADCAEWNKKQVYFYDSKNRIIKADTYFNNRKSGYILFEYDKRGNTVSRREYGTESGDFLIDECRCTYDANKNPFQNPSIYPLDMVQNNNVVSSYRYMAVMSSVPIAKIIAYSYNKDGFPSASSVGVLEYSNYQKEKFTYVYK